MSVQARERLPQPYAVVAAVSNDVVSPTLSVHLPQTEVGYGRLLWHEAYQATEESGWSGGTAPLYASALGADRIAYATPGDLQTLQFHFEPGKTVYAQLIAKPLSAIATIDCGTSRFRTVRFLNRP